MVITRPRSVRSTWVLAAILVLAPAGVARASSLAFPAPSYSTPHHQLSVNFAQNEGAADTSEVTPAEIEKYVAVYRAMHRDHLLTAESAAAQLGMSLASFRALENRIERDDAAMEQARDELQASAVHASAAPTPPRASH